MKKFLVFMLAALMCITFISCGESETPSDTEINNNEAVTSDESESAKDPEASEKPDAPVEKTFDELKAEFAAKTAEDLVKEYFADAANPTAQEFAKLYENYAFLDTKDNYEFETNNTISDAVKLIKESGAKTFDAYDSDVITYLIASEYDGARAYAYRRQASNNFDETNSVYTPILEKALSETDPKVVYAVLMGLPQSYGDNEEFWTYALSFAGSEDANVRKALANAYSRYALVGNDNAVEIMLSLMSDTDLTVKQHALRYAGCTGDDRVVDGYRAVLMDEAQAKDYHGNALLGLIELWYGYPTHARTSEAAYKLTMEYFTMDTVNPDIPSWNGLTGIKLKGSQSKYDAWRAAATYFDEKEIVNAMLGIIADGEASKNVKNSAIDNIAAWGTLEDAQTAKATIEAFPDDYKDKDSLLSKCDSAITKLS